MLFWFFMNFFVRTRTVFASVKNFNLAFEVLGLWQPVVRRLASLQSQLMLAKFEVAQATDQAVDVLLLD